MAANRPSASSMGDERSASVNITMSPSACRIPWRTLYPLPRLVGFSSSRTSGAVWANSFTTAAVSSREPSLTTTTSAFQPRARIQSTTERRVAGIRALSLYAGITMLYLGYWATPLLLFRSLLIDAPGTIEDSRHHKRSRARSRVLQFSPRLGPPTCRAAKAQIRISLYFSFAQAGNLGMLFAEAKTK